MFMEDSIMKEDGKIKPIWKKWYGQNLIHEHELKLREEKCLWKFLQP